LSSHIQQESPAVAREEALQFRLIGLKFLLQYWSLRSSKVDDFYFIRKVVCHFILVINSNLGRNSHRFRDMASFFVEKRTFFPTHLHSTPDFKMFPLN